MTWAYLHAQHYFKWIIFVMTTVRWSIPHERASFSPGGILHSKRKKTTTTTSRCTWKVKLFFFFDMFLFHLLPGTDNQTWSGKSSYRHDNKELFASAVVTDVKHRSECQKCLKVTEEYLWTPDKRKKYKTKKNISAEFWKSLNEWQVFHWITESQGLLNAWFLFFSPF